MNFVIAVILPARLDHAIHAEPDQGHAGRGQTRADRDRELDEVPPDATPSEQSRAPLKAIPVGDRNNAPNHRYRRVSDAQKLIGVGLAPNRWRAGLQSWPPPP